MSILFNILLFLHVVVCLLLVLLVMMQRPKQEGLGAAFASGMMSESFGAQTTDVLQKGTRFLAICFFVLAVSLAVIRAQQNRNILPEIKPEAVVPGEVTLPEIDLTPDSMPSVPSLDIPAGTAEGAETPSGTEEAETAPASEDSAEEAASAASEEDAAEPAEADSATPAETEESDPKTPQQ
ncbi:MAG: preprotein translocase subunit SecG [Verrucomicrobiota bacterium]